MQNTSFRENLLNNQVYEIEAANIILDIYNKNKRIIQMKIKEDKNKKYNCSINIYYYSSNKIKFCIFLVK